ncbi:MAG TPA: LytTR family DNA-binding domain-containing protein [Acidobacteriaceae bacterium]|jgi:two-component system LytT family response regulator
MISTAITDDEVLARLRLNQLLQEQPGIQVVGQASSAEETVALVKATRPDLLFLDIQMPGMDGFEAVSALSNLGLAEMPRIIFTTAYDKYAVRAFEIHAVDYLLKPYTKERFEEALNRARQQLERPAVPAANGNGASALKPLDRLIFKSRGRIVFLPVNELHAVEAEQNYVRLITADQNHLLRETISNMEERLDRTKFVRIHRSTIVNLRFVKEFRTDSIRGEHSVLMANGRVLAVSRGCRSRLLDLVTT